MGVMYGIITILDLILVALYGFQIAAAATTTALVCSIICFVCWIGCATLNGILWIGCIKEWFRRRR